VPSRSTSEGANSGAFFVSSFSFRLFRPYIAGVAVLTLWLAIWSPSQAVDARESLLAECIADRASERATVARVTDGDTLVLEGGQRVRIIGINTLELNSSSRSSRARARMATETLQELIGNQPITLIEGPESHDQHGRRLAHVLNYKRQNVGSELIRRGHATAVAVSENTLCAKHHFELEADARAEELGIWDTPSDWFVDQRALKRQDRGFKLMTTKLVAIYSGSNGPTLRFSNGVSATLGNHWPGETPDAKHIGKRVEIRGWVGGQNNKPKLTLHHPLNMRILLD